MDFPIINTRRLHLRKIGPDDQEFVYKALSDPDVIQYYGVSFNSLEATSEQMKWYEDLLTNQTGIWWMICGQDGVQYGAAGFNDRNNAHQKAELGFWLLPKYWGRGFMQEALKPVIEYGFRSLHLHRIEAFVETENAGSIRILAKMGFNHEGRMRDCEKKNGRFISLDIYARL